MTKTGPKSLKITWYFQTTLDLIAKSKDVYPYKINIYELPSSALRSDLASVWAQKFKQTQTSNKVENTPTGASTNPRTLI